MRKIWITIIVVFFVLLGAYVYINVIVNSMADNDIVVLDGEVPDTMIIAPEITTTTTTLARSPFCLNMQADPKNQLSLNLLLNTKP